MSRPLLGDELPVEKKTYHIETFALVLNDPVVDPEKLKLGYSYIVEACGYSVVSPDINVGLDYDFDNDKDRTIVESRIIKCPNIKVHVNDAVRSLAIFETNRVECRS